MTYQLHHIAHGKVAEATCWLQFKKEICNLPYPRPDFNQMERFINEGSAFTYAVQTLVAYKKLTPEK